MLYIHHILMILWIRIISTDFLLAGLLLGGCVVITGRHENPNIFFCRHWRIQWKITWECTSTELGITCLRKLITPSGSQGTTKKVRRSGTSLLTDIINRWWNVTQTRSIPISKTYIIRILQGMRMGQLKHSGCHWMMTKYGSRRYLDRQSTLLDAPNTTYGHHAHGSAKMADLAIIRNVIKSGLEPPICCQYLQVMMIRTKRRDFWRGR